MLKPALAAFVLSGVAGLAVAPSRGVAEDSAPKRRGAVEVVASKPTTETAAALAAAAELVAAGDPFFGRFFARGWPTTPEIKAATVGGAARASRAALGKYLLGAPPAVPLARSPYTRLELLRLRQELPAGAPESAEALIAARLRLYARAAGLGEPSRRAPAVPLFPAETAAAPGDGGGGGATTPVAIDLEAIGAALVAEVRWAERLLVRRGPPGTPGGDLLGETPADGFDGLLYLTLAVAQLASLKHQAAFDGKALGPVPVGDYDPYDAPRWFPHRLGVKGFGPEGTPDLIVLDPESRLADQAWLLLGAAELAALAGPGRGDAAPPVFGPLRVGDVRDEVFPQTTHVLARDVARFVFQNLAALHFDATPGRPTLVSEAGPGGRGTRLATADAALALVALEAAARIFSEDTRLKGEVRKLIYAQATFLADRQREDGSFPAEFQLAAKPEGAGGGAAGAASPAASARAQALAVRGLLAAFRASEEERFKAAALKAASFLERRCYDPWAALYLDAVEPAAGAPVAIGARDAAALLGALREVATDLGSIEALYRYRDLWRTLVGLGVVAPDGDLAEVEVKVGR